VALKFDVHSGFRPLGAAPDARSGVTSVSITRRCLVAPKDISKVISH
jgi:hypothetical protein